MMRTKPRLSRCTNMAAGERRNVALLACVLCVLFGQAASDVVKGFPETKTVRMWASRIGENLERFFNALSGYHAVKESYNTVTRLEFREVKEDKLVRAMAEKLSKMLSKKMDALWDLVLAAEEAAKNYTYRPQLKKGQVSYYNSKDMGGVDLQFDTHFKQAVNFNFSSVHIPVEIYDGDVNILNGMEWTSALDKQLKKNHENDKQILWQFFGSQTGFMRTYPASKWNTHGSVDLFDVRRQSWYTQGSSSPKDMMILIDTSGSTHGQALQLMKNAVKSILDTLGENDFVNIVAFSSDAKFVGKCFNQTAFVQANYRNKKQLAKDVEELRAQGQADYQKGLTFAFEKFKEFSENRTDKDTGIGAKCNKVIILLTDGGTDNAEEVFKEYNWPNKSVRVFTYAVGPTATPVNAIKWMACANRGYFSKIPAMGAIRARVQDYLEVLGRPLALSYVEHTQWSSSHKNPLNPDYAEYTMYLKQGMEQLDVQPFLWEITVEPREYIPVLSRPQVLKNAKSFEWGNVYKDHLGLGMMTTVTLPVYNRTLGSSNQTILGVMGIDVATTELGKRTPYLKIGPVGYSFAINPNGYAVFHPNLKNTGRYMKDPPNIDLLELEQEQEEGDLMKLRNHMVDGVSDTMEIQDTLFLSPDKKYVTLERAKYAFTNISNTTFRLGLTVPEYPRWYPYFPDATNLPIFSLPENLRSVFKIAPWDYLGTLPQQQDLDDNLATLVDKLKGEEVKAYNFSEDELQLLHHLAMDFKAGMTLADYSKAFRIGNISESDSSAEDIGNNTEYAARPNMSFVYRFMATNGGLTFVYPPNEANKFADDFDIHNSTYYKRSMFTYNYIISAETMDNKTQSFITASRSVNITKGNYRVAVSGVTVEADRVRNSVLGIISNMSKAYHNKLNCDDVDNLACYLIDDGGFMIISNQDNDTSSPGQFIGEIDPQLWKELLTLDVFGRSVQYDFQAVCTVKKPIGNAGHRSVFVPSFTMLFETLTTGWWTSKVSWAFSSFNIYNWLFGYSGVYGEDESEEENKVVVQESEEDCVLAIQQFYLRRPLRLPYFIKMSCSNHTRQIQIEAVPMTNLLLVVSHLPCGNDPPISHKPYRISGDQEEKLVCSLAKQPHKRVQSYGCYDNDPNEDDTKCDAAAHPSSRLLSVTAACITLITAWLLSGDHR